MGDPLFSDVARLSWQGGVVLGLLFLGIFLSQCIKSIPRDLIFTITALLSSLFSIVSSTELYQACANQAMLSILGLWVFGVTCQQQGIFHSLIPWYVCLQKNTPIRRGLFYLQVAFCGAILHHRYFPMATLRLLAHRFEKKKADPSILGFPFAYCFLIGGLTTAIGTSVNIVFLTLYSAINPSGLSQFFVFFPLACLPIILSVLLLVILQKFFRKLSPQFLEAPACAVVLPDSILIRKTKEFKIVRGQRSLANAKLESGDLVVASKVPVPPALTFFSEKVAHLTWKAWVALILFLTAITTTFFGNSIGTALFTAGLLLFLIHPFSIKKVFREEFPLPLILEIFSAFIFYFALKNSGLSQWIASSSPVWLSSPVILLSLLFCSSQIAAHLMPRPLAFVLLFSVAQALFVNHPTQLFFAGTNIAFAAAVPLFGKPTIDEIAISTAMSGRSVYGIRAALILILFASVVIPSCLFWPI